MSRMVARLLTSLALALSGAVRAADITLTPVKDNTLIESLDSPLSNALGDAVFSGRTSSFAEFTRRRSVLAFDVAGAVPAGSVIQSASLNLFLLRTRSISDSHSLHRLLANWGEGTSSSSGGGGAPATAGDATWVHRFYPDQLWTTPGGDFEAIPSATIIVNNVQGTYTWGSTPSMVADVQGWLDNPAGNFGWVLIGNEVDVQTARKFASRETITPANRPRLQISFIPPCGPGDIDCDGSVNETDRDLFVGVLLGTNNDPQHIARCDVNGDSVANGRDIPDMVQLLLTGP